MLVSSAKVAILLFLTAGTLAQERATGSVRRQQSNVRYSARSRKETVAKISHQDDGYTLLTLLRNIELPGSEQALTGRMPAGARFVPYSEKTFTASVSTSVEVTDEAFAVFQNSIDEEVSRDQTLTSAFGGNTDLNVDCEAGQEGVLYWYPLYTIYQGVFTPSGDRVDFNIPVNSTLGTSFGVRCFD
jgi:hypothetical protein